MAYAYAANVSGSGLQVQANSPLNFPYAEYNPQTIGTFDAHLGPDGVGVGMTLLIRWSDLQTACKQILGYSYRDPGSTLPQNPSTTDPAYVPGIIRRVLPLQHPFMANLWAKAITKVQGVRLAGKGPKDDQDQGFILKAGDSAGVGSDYRNAPYSDYQLALLTVAFWRPPYLVRTDQDVFEMASNTYREWRRYTDTHWQVNSNMLSREGGAFAFKGLPSGATTDFPGSVGHVVTHLRMSRTWYEIPESCVFQQIAEDGTFQGPPLNLLYTQTDCNNLLQNGLAGALLYTYPKNSPIGGTLNAPRGGRATSDDSLAGRFFGMPAGTLRFDGAEIKPRPLQLPAALMNIPAFGASEPRSQVQYDVTFNFDFFDPAPGKNVTIHGHNLMPWAGDSKWYPVLSKLDVNGLTTGPFLTPYMYSDFSDLFKPL